MGRRKIDSALKALRKKIADQKYRDEHKVEAKAWRDAHKSQRAEYLKTNKAKIATVMKEWHKNHKLEYSEYVRVYCNTRRRTDPAFRAMRLCRASFTKWFKSKGYHKYGHVSELLGCSFKELCQHLESQFKPGMTWENQGYYGWHIDHIKPLASFDPLNPEHLKEAWHYTNMQPLWAKENFTKSDYFVEVSHV